MVTLTLLQFGSKNDLFSMTEEEGIQKKNSGKENNLTSVTATGWCVTKADKASESETSNCVDSDGHKKWRQQQQFSAKRDNSPHFRGCTTCLKEVTAFLCLKPVCIPALLVTFPVPVAADSQPSFLRNLTSLAFTRTAQPFSLSLTKPMQHPYTSF